MRVQSPYGRHLCVPPTDVAAVLHQIGGEALPLLNAAASAQVLPVPGVNGCFALSCPAAPPVSVHVVMWAQFSLITQLFCLRTAFAPVPQLPAAPAFCLCYYQVRAEDEEVFDMNPIEYIRRDR